MKLFKKSRLFNGLLFAVVLIMAACNQDQSSFSINDIEGEATITGTLTYNLGQEYNNGRFTENIVAGANKTVYVEIDNKDLSPNGSAQGYQTYSTVTDEEGKYEIKVPAVAVSGGIVARVRAEDFAATRKIVKDFENFSPLFENTDVIFTATEENVTIQPNRIAVANFNYGFKEISTDRGFEYSIPLRVIVGDGRFLRNEVTSQVSPYFQGKAGANSVITVTYHDEEDEEGNSGLVRKFGATTDTDGSVVIYIPSREKRPTLGVHLETYAYTGSLPYIPDYDATDPNSTLKYASGIYRQFVNGDFVEGGTDLGSIYFENLSDSYTVVRSRMVLKPNTGDSSGYNPYDWNWTNATFN